MNENQAEARAEYLRNQINIHNHLYYVMNSPEISDYEFDMMLEELRRIEKDFPNLAVADSPTVRVGSDLHEDDYKNEFIKYPHKYPMLSLGNTYNMEELTEFDERVSKSAGSPFSYCCELKFDGTAICLTYENGVLTRALTRGDGEKGDDVTENVKQIRNIPHKLMGRDYPDEFEIRGEIYMPYESFEKLNEEREKAGEPLFANPRNAASGSLKLKSPKEVASRGLSCVLYHVPAGMEGLVSHYDIIKKVSEWGLPVSDNMKLCNNLEDALQFIEYWDKERGKLPFPTDGVVLKVNEISLQETMGYTAKSPRWAVAYKFKAEQVITVLESIDYQVGRTGIITPVANLAPVFLAGTTIRRASLSNADIMSKLDVRIGDHVYIEKGGEIIPKITGVDFSKRKPGTSVPEFPDRCPDCKSLLVKKEGEARFFCPNETGCPTQIKGKLLHFAGRNAMDINAGSSTIGLLYDKGIVKKFSDFYELKPYDLVHLKGWKEQSISNLIESIAASKSKKFDQVLYSLGIKNIGIVTSKILAARFRSMDSLMKAGKEELMSVNEIGEIIADSIIEYFENEANISEINKLKAYGLNFEWKDNVASGIFDNIKFCITGTFSIPRKELIELIEQNGGKYSSSCGKSVSVLLVGKEPGEDKLKKAEEAGIKMMTEAEFCSETGIDIKKQETLFDL